MSRVSQARSLGKYFLLVDNMLVVLGFFVVFPLISIRFVDQMGWAALMVGIALGLRQFVQQGLGVFGGAIADRFGAKPMIVTGMLLRAAGLPRWRSPRSPGCSGSPVSSPVSAARCSIRPHRAGGKADSPAAPRPFLLDSDDAGQCRGGYRRPAGKLAAAV
jgi:MFS family permease